MPSHSKSIAIIPARGGSKRLPGKNLLPLDGKPLIAWSIEAALASRVADLIVVTSDDDETLSVAKSFSGVVSHRRSPELSGDTTPSIDVALDVLIHHELAGVAFESAIFLQPTSPLRRAEHIAGAYELFKSGGGRSVVSVCEVDHPLQWCGTIDQDGFLRGFQGLDGTRSQDYPASFRLNGAVYISSVPAMKKNQSFFTRNTLAYRMSREDSIDIDNRIDFTICSEILKDRKPRG